MAVIVSKKVAKSAVVRNRIRRRLYEAVRTSKLFDETPVDVVFVVRSEELVRLPHDALLLQLAKVGDKVAENRS